MVHLVSGISMSSLPKEIPALNASRKPMPMIWSQKITDSFWPQ
jgi:hypothetical protein